MAATKRELDAFAIFDEAIVHENAVSLAEQKFPFFFDFHRKSFLDAHHEDMEFFERFIEEAAMFFDRLIIHFDCQSSQQLIELVLNSVFLDGPDFQREFHRADCVELFGTSQKMCRG